MDEEFKEQEEFEGERSGGLRYNLQTRDRLTAQVNIYHEHWGEQPVAAHCSTQRFLDTQEQPFQRRITVGPEWVPLSRAWGTMLESVGVILLENRAGRSLMVTPTDEEWEVIQDSVIQVAIQKEAHFPFARIVAGAFLLLEPEEPELLHVRCPHPTPLLVWAFPR